MSHKRSINCHQNKIENIAIDIKFYSNRSTKTLEKIYKTIVQTMAENSWNSWKKAKKQKAFICVCVTEKELVQRFFEMTQNTKKNT